MTNFLYFDIEHAIKVHDEIIDRSGGLHGQNNLGYLKSILDHVKNDTYYPEIEHKLTHLFYSVNKNHAFADGNKRSSIALSAYFMEINGFDFRVSKFMVETENLAVDVADNIIDKDLLFDIIGSILYEEDYSEELKLKIIKSKMR